MGRRGPMPKPTALRVLEGRVQHRALPKGEPKPRIGPPPCPADLDPEAKAEWKVIVDEWMRSAPKLLTRVDGGVLAQYCQCKARWMQAERAIAVELVAGKPLDRFQVLIAIKYSQQMHLAADRLGLSPAARTRLTLPDSSDEDDAFLNARPSRG